jgi:hypothetical protein
MEACRASRLRLFSSRYSKRTYTQRQHACVLLIMKRLRLHYRDATELLEVSPGLTGALGLSRVPHFTTLQKFFQRCGGFVLTVLLSHTARLSAGSGVIAIDATGFSSNTASRYYSMFRYRHEPGVWSASYIRNSAAVDLESQTVIGFVCRNNHSHESVDFNMVLRKAARTEKVNLVIADRGYDFERVHVFARDVMKVDTLIPVRKAIRNGKISGLYRRRMYRRSNWKAYNKRSRIEGVFSVMKRKFGDVVYGRSWIMQRKEMALICCAYNVHRYVVLSFFIRIEVFYKTV